MSKNLNLCQFIGRFGNDPEIKYMPSGDAVANFSIACGDDYKDKQGNKVEQTNWINIVAFGRLAEIIGEYGKKGSKIYVSGKQRTRKWQAQDGSDRYTTEIVANYLEMLGGKQDQSTDSNQTPKSNPHSSKGQPEPYPMEAFDDDIPFFNPYKYIEYVV